MFLEKISVLFQSTFLQAVPNGRFVLSLKWMTSFQLLTRVKKSRCASCIMEHAQYSVYICALVVVRNLGWVSQAFQPGFKMGTMALWANMLQNRNAFYDLHNGYGGFQTMVRSVNPRRAIYVDWNETEEPKWKSDEFIYFFWNFRKNCEFFSIERRN